MWVYLMIALVLAVVLLAVWKWDERARRAELHRRRLQREPVTGSHDDGAGTLSSKAAS